MALHRSVPVSSKWPLVGLGLFLLVLLHAAPPALAASSARRIVLVEGMTPTQPAVVQTIEGFENRLKQRKADDIEVATEFLDLKQFRGPKAENRFVRFLKAKFDDERPDLIVAISRGATSFAIRHHKQFAPDIPVVYCCTPTSATDNLNIPPDIPGVLVEYDWAGTLALAERLQPNATTLMLVSGDSEIARAWHRDAIESLRPFLGKYDTRYLVSSRADELTREVSRLPRNSIVILTPIFRERVTATGYPTEIALDVAKASPAPVYSPVTSLLGGGIVGGSMDDYVAQGAKAADLALDILAGKNPSTLPHQTRFPLHYRVDARALERWRLSEAALPAGTQVEYREPTLWEKYRYWAVAAALAFAAQATAIALLLIHRRKRQSAEKLLKESEDRMAFAAASTNIGIWRLEVDSGLLWATDHCRAMFGISPGLPLTWELFRGVVHPEDRETFEDCVRTPVRFGLPMATEFRIVLPGHNVSWCICRGHTVCDGEGRPLHVTGIFIDVTARKIAEAEADLQRQELNHIIRVAALGELSNRLARELSQPLTAIVANAAAAQSIAKHDRQEVAHVLKEIVEDSERAGQVVHRLRTLLKRGERRAEHVDLNRVVESTLNLLRPELASRKIKPETDLAVNPPTVAGDAAQLQQVLVSLVTNAMEAMDSTPPASRRLGVRTRVERGGYLEVEVSDRGRGLTSHEVQNLFRPFFTTKERGLGLGLWICSTIVASHGGMLKLANTPSGGVLAVVSLPVATEANQRGHADSRAA